MIFICKNCGGNVHWNPSQDRMICPHCDSVESEDLKPTTDENYCQACGAPLEPGKYSSAVKCEYCNNYTIFESKTNGEYEPHLIIPFRVDKERAKAILREEFGKKLFLPSDFLRDASLEKLEGDYIPFYLFDYHCHYRYAGKATKIRTWTVGDTQYTETSYYQILRTMDVNFSRIPVDASIAMPDEMMDLLEPFDYSGMVPFLPKYMSGFLGEYYNMPSESLEPRGKAKARNDAKTMMMDSINMGFYNSVVPEMEDCDMTTQDSKYALLPIWNYRYSYHGKDYIFHLNGETGKLVGAPPISMAKLVACGSTVFASVLAIGYMVMTILSMV